MPSDEEPCFATSSQVEQSYSEYQDGLNLQNCARADAARELNPPMDDYVQFLWENFGEADLLLLSFTVVAHWCLVTMLMTTGLPLPALTPSRSRTLTDIGANPNPHPNPNPKANPNPNPNLNPNPNPTAYPKTSANPNHDQVP